MKINEIKNILDYAKECGCLVTITLVSGQVSHINFNKQTKTFTATDDVILDEEGHLVIKFDTDGGAKISFDFNSVGGETSFNCNTKNRTLTIMSGSTVVFTRKYIDCSAIQYIEIVERTN